MESASTQTSRAQSPLYKDRATSPIITFERKNSVRNIIFYVLNILVWSVTYIISYVIGNLIYDYIRNIPIRRANEAARQRMNSEHANGNPVPKPYGFL